MTPEAEAEQALAIRRFFGQPVTFERGIARMSDLPEADRQEIAFAGRSNVGKSSLINALLNRKGLARASAEPGRTRELNFFRLGESLRIVDLPGYGYARAPKAEIERWTRLTGAYLRGRPQLARVFLLIDARHGLMKPDEAVMDALDEAALVYQITLTKADKIRPDQVAQRSAESAQKIARRPAAHPVLLATSAAKGDGLDALRLEIMALAGGAT